MLENFLKVNLATKCSINAKVADNCSKLKPSLLLPPLIFLFLIVAFIFLNGSFSIEGYIQIQKEYFYFINSKLSQFPALIYNLTEFGDAFIFLCFLTILMLYSPKFWEVLIVANLVSAVFSLVFKKLFSVPRPAAVFDKNSFTIIGKVLTGHNSLPSGHSITVFTILTVILFSFVPRKHKIIWVSFMFITGLILVSTRVGVGAHYPIDVIVGGTFGYISGILGLLITQKYRNWFCLDQTKYCPVLMVLFTGCCFVLVFRILEENLTIFYLSLIALLIPLSKIIYVYVKR